MSLKTKMAVILLLSVFAAQCIFSIRTKSPTSDELAHHIASGYSHLVMRDFRMNPAMPPLPRLLSAVPLYFLGAKMPSDPKSWNEGNSPIFAHEFFYQANKNADELIFWARIPILFLSLIFAFLVFIWSKELWGVGGGLAALTLYVFCPDVVAHSSLATSDISVAFFFTLTFYLFWKYLKAPSGRGLLFTGLAAGGAFLSKFSAILLFPILLCIALISKNGRAVPPKKISLFLLVCLMTVWAGYFFETKPVLKNTPDPLKKIAFLNQIGGEPLVRFAQKVPVPLSTFASAMTGIFFTRAKGTHSFLMGHWSDTGWWYYYFVAFALKNTLPFLALIFLSFIFLKRLKLDSLTLTTLFLPVIFFFVVTMPDRAQAGIRYFLPIYPLFFILCAGTVVFLCHKGKVWRFLAIGLLAWHAAEAGMIAPDYLAYFNESIGGPKNGYKYLRDSNIDWGQDLKGLGKYIKEKGYPEVALFYFGPADPDYYGIPYRTFGQDEFETPRHTVYAVAAHHIDSVKWTAEIQPTCVIGHSIFVYDLRSPDFSKKSA